MTPIVSSAGVPGIPEIIAHRGASRECRENTLAAFTRAMELGSDGIELDVHASRDNILIVHHDQVIQNADGSFSPPISSLTGAEIAAIRMPGGDSVPTLERVLELVADSVFLYLEVKASRTESFVSAIIARHPLARVAVHSFDHRIPVAIRALSPGLSIGLLSASYPLDVGSVLLPAAAQAFWMHSDLIDEELVRNVHTAGARLIAWTENSVERARELASWGVDGLCTDIPSELRNALH